MDTVYRVCTVNVSLAVCHITPQTAYHTDCSRYVHTLAYKIHIVQMYMCTHMQM